MLLYIIIFLISVVTFIVLNLLNLPIDDKANYYILSSISQGLAALLALVFTAILIIVQVFRRFRAWKIVVSPQNKSVIICYCISIILPLIFLRIGVTTLMVNTSISLAILCVSILFPFIMSFGQVMTGPIVLAELEQNIIDVIDKKARGPVISYVSDFKDIWLLKINKKDCVSLDEIWDIWLNINIRIRSLKNYKTEVDVILSICDKLVKIDSKKNAEYFQKYAVKVYNSFHLNLYYTPPVRNIVCDHYIQKSLDILRVVIGKNFINLSIDIVAALSLIAWQKWSRAGPVPDRDKEAIPIMKQILDVDRRFVERTLRSPEIIPKLGQSGPEKQKKLIELLDAIRNTDEGQHA